MAELDGAASALLSQFINRFVWLKIYMYLTEHRLQILKQLVLNLYFSDCKAFWLFWNQDWFCQILMKVRWSVFFWRKQSILEITKIRFKTLQNIINCKSLLRCSCFRICICDAWLRASGWVPGAVWSLDRLQCTYSHLFAFICIYMH